MQLSIVATVLAATVASCVKRAEIAHFEHSEFLMRKLLTRLENNLNLEVNSLPEMNFYTVEPVCGQQWIGCPGGMAFYQTKRFVAGNQANSSHGTHFGLNVTLEVRREELRRVTNLMSERVSMARQKTEATIESTSEGWSFGAQMSLMGMKGLGPGMLGSASVGVSGSYSRYESRGTQVSVAETSTYSCPYGFECHSEAWVPYVTVSGRCTSSTHHQCGGARRNTCKANMLSWACAQLQDWKRTRCSAPEVCSVTTPVMEGDRPWVTEVFFEEAIRDESIHPKPRITGYQSGKYVLGSTEYLYDPNRSDKRYYTTKDGWHDNRVYPTLDAEIAQFRHRAPKIDDLKHDCYHLLTSEEWYCPWEPQEAKYYFQSRSVMYPKPTAPDPPVSALVAFLEANLDKISDTDVLDQYLKMFNAAAGLDLEQTRVNAQGADGRTPLIWAMMQGYDTMIDLLLSVPSIDLNRQDRHGRTALSWAAAGGYTSIVARLLGEEGIDVNLADDAGKTPMHWAVEAAQDGVVAQLLLADTIDASRADAQGRTPLWSAVHGGARSIIGRLASHPDAPFAQQAHDRRAPLTVAAERGDLDTVRGLMAMPGVDVNVRDGYGQTPLMAALQYGHDDVFNALLDSPAIDANLLDSHGRSVLSIAAKHNDLAAAQRLLSLPGVDPNARAGRSKPALTRAVLNANESLARLLLDPPPIEAANPPRTNPNLVDELGRDALSYAAESNQLQVVKLLLTHLDTLPAQPDQFGRTPLSYAAERGHAKVVAALLRSGGSNPDATDQHHRTAVVWAAMGNHTDVVREFCDPVDASLNQPDQNTQTPLLYAVQLGNRAMVRALLDTGMVDPRYKDEKNATALSWASKFGFADVVDMVNQAKILGRNTTWMSVTD